MNETCDAPLSMPRPLHCHKPAKWWFRFHREGEWHPRCGRHALMPGNTERERRPIDSPPLEGKQ